MYKKLKVKLNDYIFNTNELEMKIKVRVKYLVFMTDRSEKEIDKCIILIIKDLKKLLL